MVDSLLPVWVGTRHSTSLYVYRLPACTATVLCLLYNALWYGQLFLAGSPHLSTVAWRPVPRRRMPRDATRPFSRSDSSSCAIRCRLFVRGFGALLLHLLPWRAAILLTFSVSLCWATGYGLWIGKAPLLACPVPPALESAWAWARAWARQPGYASRTAKETVSQSCWMVLLPSARRQRTRG